MKYLKDQQGLTLIETIVALVLVVLLVAAFAGALVVGLQSEVDVDLSLKSGDMAETIMEYLSVADIEKFIDERNYNDGINLLDFLNDVETIEDEVNGANYLFSSRLLDFYERNVDEEGSQIKIKNEEMPDNLVEVEILIKWEERGQDWVFDLVSKLRVEDN